MSSRNHTSVETASLQALLALVNVEQLSEEKGPDGLSPRHHYYRCKHAQTLTAQGDVPTVFGHESQQAEDKVKAWIAEMTDKGYDVHFTIGHPAVTERLSVCWTAVEKLKRGGTCYKGSIDMSGKQFTWG